MVIISVELLVMEFDDVGENEVAEELGNIEELEADTEKLEVDDDSEPVELPG